MSKYNTEEERAAGRKETNKRSREKKQRERNLEKRGRDAWKYASEEERRAAINEKARLRREANRKPRKKRKSKYATEDERISARKEQLRANEVKRRGKRVYKKRKHIPFSELTDAQKESRLASSAKYREKNLEECRRRSRDANRNASQEVRDRAKNNLKTKKDVFRNFCNNIKIKNGCKECGDIVPSRLAFHHIGEKNFSISYACASLYDLDKIKTEIDKCIILCHNHHRIFHYENKIRKPWSRPDNEKRYNDIKNYCNLVKMASGCCACGTDDFKCLDFHHVDKKEKKFDGFSTSIRSIESIKNEISKCVVICANCHSDLHRGVSDAK